MMKCLLLAELIFVVLTSTSAVYESVRETLNNVSMPYEDYSGLGLQDVPPDVPRNTSALLLDYNNLTSISDQFWTSDCADNNQPVSCSRLPKLVVLDLSYNQIENFSPHAFHTFKWLRVVILNNNKIQTLYHNLFLSNILLETIDISANMLSFLPPNIFQNLSNLGRLQLEKNKIDAIHKDTFKRLYALENLNISENNISELDADLFNDLGLLTLLALDHNNITSISETIFRPLRNLRELSVSHNKLISLSPGIFSTTKLLRFVFLSHNLIQEISRYTYLELLRTQYVDLSYNLLESVYLSRIPVNLTIAENSQHLIHNTGLCEHFVYLDVAPCFVISNYFDQNTLNFHFLDFSYNNISKIIFNKASVSHTLEMAVLLFAGNKHLNIPFSFVKQERYIMLLNLDETSLSWRNMTLLNDILKIPHLKTLSISGSPACEYYMHQIISSVFDPNNQILIICDEHTSSIDTTLPDTPISRDLHRDSENTTVNNSTNNVYPCHNFENEVYLNETILGNNILLNYSHLVDCSYASISILPKINSTLSCLIFSHNDITFLEDNYFHNLKGLEYLDLAFNHLEFLSPHVFNNVNALQILLLNNNNLVHLSHSTFKNLKSLKLLALHGNRISSYDGIVFSNLLNLQFLSLDFCNLTTFHYETFDNLANLLRLDMRETCKQVSPTHTLSSQQFSNLHSLIIGKVVGFHVNSSSICALFNSKILRDLEFEGGMLPELAGNTFEKTVNVKSIKLARNGIKDLHNNVFQKLNNLSYLDISQNEIKCIQSDLFVDVALLTTLNISYNLITCIPSNTFEYLSMLEVLDMRYNFIANFNWKTINPLSRLHSLSLEGNYVGITLPSKVTHICSCTTTSWNTTLHIKPTLGFEKCVKNIDAINATIGGPSVYSHNSGLIRFILRRNCIPRISGNAFTNSTLLQYNDLSHNNIIDIDIDTFQATPKLIHLFLSFNSLSIVRRGLFRNLVDLLSLELAYNILEVIEEEAFRDLHSLHSLYIQFNRLKTFNFNLLPTESHLDALFINDNRLTSLETTQDLQAFKHLFSANNQLKQDISGIFHHMPNLLLLDLSNTSLHALNTNTFNNSNRLHMLSLGNNPSGSLKCQHFTKMRDLLILNVSAEENTRDTGLSWKNITLLNCLFEIHNLNFLVLTGHPLCGYLQRTQIIENIFLSEVWKQVICSDHVELPNFFVSQSITSLPVSGIRYLDHLPYGYRYEKGF